MTVPQRAKAAWVDGWYVVPYDVLFRDVDSFGHVNNAVYFTLFEWARTQLWFAITGGRNARDIDFIVAHAECDFRAQIAMEPIEIRVRIGEIRNSSFDTVYEIVKIDGQQLAATGKVVVVLFDWDANRKIAMSDALRRKIRSFQGEPME
jgi:acyl-CoA thioester hydrolase